MILVYKCFIYYLLFIIIYFEINEFILNFHDTYSRKDEKEMRRNALLHSSICSLTINSKNLRKITSCIHKTMWTSFYYYYGWLFNNNNYYLNYTYIKQAKQFLMTNFLGHEISSLPARATINFISKNHKALFDLKKRTRIWFVIGPFYYFQKIWL